MRKILAALALAACILSPALAQTGPKFGKNGGVGSATSTFASGEPTGGTYAINGTTGQASFGGVNFKPQSTAPVSPANGDCWLLTGSGLYCRVGSVTVGPFAQRYAPIVADGYTSADGAATSASTTFSAASRACVTADVGKVIVVGGGAASNGALKTTVASCSGSSYVLSAAAGATITSAQWSLGTDNSSLLNSLVAANPKATLLLPPGQILLDTNTVNLTSIVLQGAGSPSNRIATRGTSANYGTTFLLTSPTVKPFAITNAVRVTGVNFFWPGQAGTVATPVAYPPLFNDNGVNQLSDFWLEKSTIVNSYDVMTQGSACAPWGGIHFNDNHIYTVRRVFSLCSVGELIFVNGTIVGPGVFYEGTVASANNYLGKYTVANGTIAYIFGNGTNGGACSTTPVQGITFAAGTLVTGTGSLTTVDGGWLDESNWDSSSDANGVAQIAVVKNNGLMTRVAFQGRYYPTGAFGVATTEPAFDFAGNCTPATQGDVQISGNIVGAQAGILRLRGSNMGHVDIVGLKAYNYGATAGLGSPIYFADINSTGATYVNIVGSVLNSAYSTANYKGVLLTNAAALTFTGNQCITTYTCIDVSGAGGTNYVTIAGNTSVADGATYSTAGTLTAFINVGANAFAKPNPNFDGLAGQFMDTNSRSATNVYYLPTANGQTYTIPVNGHSVLIDNAVNTVTTATVQLPAAPADGYIVRIGGTAAITTLTLSPGASDVTRCGSGALPNGQALACVFRRGIGPAAPNGAWFTY